jgi:hypothetical protein
MRFFINKISLVCIFFLAAGRVWADEAAAVLKRAIEAHGGAARLERTKRGHIKAEWKGKRLGTTFDLIREETFDLPGRYRLSVKGTEGGIISEMELGFDGRKVWNRQGQRPPQYEPWVKPLPLEGHWHAILAQLLQLQSKDTELKFLGEETKAGRRLVGIRAVSPHAAADLYFDKSTGLLARAQRPLPGPEPGKNMIGENVYSDYREIGGVQYPMHCEGTVQNIYALDIRIISLEFIDKIDDGVFAKPAVSRPPEPPAPPEEQPEERPSAESPARWDVRFLVATLAAGSFVAVVWLIVRGSKGRKQQTPPQ